MRFIFLPRVRFFISFRFLIEGDKGSVLHTGDFRAEPWFINSLVHNPYLQPFIASRRVSCDPNIGGKIVKTLQAIYLDTACLLSPLVIPSKACTILSSCNTEIPYQI